MSLGKSETTSNGDRPPQGQRYTHVYVERGAPGPITPTARSRLTGLVISFRNLADLASEIEREMGLLVGNWRLFFTDELSPGLLLDAITIIRRWFVQGGGLTSHLDAVEWVNDVNRIFREENINYHVDKLGGVHPFVDEEFQRNRMSTLAALAGVRYRNVARNYDDAHKYLATEPPQGAKAIRAIFHALEGLFRQMFPKEPSLTAGRAAKRLEPLIQKLYANNTPALRAASKLLQSFGGWIDAAHFYRHEPALRRSSNRLSPWR